MEKDSKIYIAGHGGMVGSALMKILLNKGYSNLIYRTSKELDLTRQSDVEKFFKKEKPEYVFLAAAKVGSIYVNSIQPADFLYKNLMIESNVINTACEHDVKKLCFIGSGCVYPESTEQPMRETAIMKGPLEKTNEAYAFAKLAGLKMCEYYNRQYGTDYIAVMPSNLYGYGDNYNPDSAHVVPSLIRKFHEAKEKNINEVIVWGTGLVRREFLFADDLADACVFLMHNYSSNDCINIGFGSDITIKELSERIKKIIGYKGNIVQDTSKPDGNMRKLLDSSKIFSMGWRPKTTIDDGLILTYQDYLKNKDNYRS